MEQDKAPGASAQNSLTPSAAWLELSPKDIDSLIRIAPLIHPSLPESSSVFLERINLFPDGCLSLIESKNNSLCGYAISHPIRRREPPALDALLGEIAPDADQYYIHDVAILPDFQGRGFAQQAIEKLLEVAKRFPTTGLVSVYGTVTFWGRFGFLPASVDGILEEKLKGYGDDAVYLERRNEDYKPPMDKTNC